ncbi:hypothetical protein SUGI_1029020 [Cryptomeria japonica]|uniref:serine carboxypeptidase-like 42 n=1 Tax=Cryptomeria japonica TaxID=3369 RepID=UPI002414B518|nr:serine carboxypeptidase-like 42 [Cryptomeria japonica]GLJ48800.1 hypothetical protein SUGI_1029020 [Cryptomeria japonica]
MGIWVAWIWFLVMTGGVVGAPLEDLVRSLPGQPAVSFRQYAGYVTVDQVAGTALFYYFVEAEKNATNLPLVLWLNGGPGCSSIGGGAFTELGPFFPSGGLQNGLTTNSHSWNRVANLLFVDSPAGVGWSYSNSSSAYSYNDERVANETMTFLMNWLHKFPEYKTRDLFLAGESYAGHYIPQLASLILRYNTHSRQLSRAFKFNLKAITVGNPLLNYGLDTSATYFFLWSHGLISDHTYKGVSSSCDFSDGTISAVEETLEAAENEKAGTCPFFVAAAHNEVGANINMYDVTLDVCPPPIIRQALRLRKRIKHRVQEKGIDVCIDNEITSYLNRHDVQQALHANTTALPYPWEACSRVIEYKFEDQLQDMLPVITSLIKQGLPVWIFSGDQDSVVPLIGTRTQIDKLAKELNLKILISYSAWYAHGQVGGWTEVYDKLVYTTVRGASHMVPYAQPERALVMFQRFLVGKPLPRHSYSVKIH